MNQQNTASVNVENNKYVDVEIMKIRIKDLDSMILRILDIASSIHFKRVETCRCHSNGYTGPQNCCSCKYIKIAQRDLDSWASRRMLPFQAERAMLSVKLGAAIKDLETAESLLELSGKSSISVNKVEISNPMYSDRVNIISENMEVQSGECMIDALDSVIQEKPADSDEDEAFCEALYQMFGDDPDDEFVTVAQNANSVQENPITFFVSTGGHLVPRTLAHYWDEVLTVESTSTLRSYIDAMELGMPHLKTDILEWILFKTRQLPVGRPWDEKYLVREVIDLAREHFATKVASAVTARARMGIDDRLTPQAGIMCNLEKAYKALIKEQDVNIHAGVQMAQLKEFPGIAHLLENIAWFYRDWRASKTPMDCMISVYRFLKGQFGFSLSAGIACWIVDILDDLKADLDSVAGVFNETQGDETVEPQAGFGEFIDMYKSVTRSSVYEKISKLAVLIASLAMCFVTGTSLDGSKFMSVCRQIYSGLKATDIFGQIMEAILAVYNKCIPVLMGQASVSSIWVGLGDGKQLDLDILDFITVGERYVDGTSNADDKLPEVLLIEVVDILRRLNEMMKSSPDAMSRSHLKRTILQVEKVRQGVCNRHNNAGMRIAPFFVSLNGISGVGKTALILELTAALQLSEKLPAGPKHVFRMDDQDSYQSGLNSQHNAYIIDDYGNTKAQFAKIVPTDVIIQLANNCPKFAVMADLAAKGAVPMKPHFLILTTNVKHLHAATYSECKESILRRPHYHVTMIVRQEYADGEGKLKDDVVPTDHKMDCWLFIVEQYLPNHADAVDSFKTVEHDGKLMNGVDFKTLVRFLVAKSKVHHARQRGFIEASNTVHTVPRCECGVPESLCEGCEYTPQYGPEPQAGWFEPERNLVNTYMGVRQVMQAPFGRDLVLAHVYKNILIFIAVFSLGLLLEQKSHIFILLWILVLSLILAITFHRVTTYKISLEVQPVVQHCVENMRDKLLGNKAKIAAALIAAVGVYKIYHETQKVAPQGSTPSRPRVNFEVGKIPDNWKRTEVVQVPKNGETVTATGKQLAEVLQAKICTVSVFTDTTHKFAAAIPVVTNFWIVPYHLINSDYEKVRIQHTGDDVINYSHTTLREGSYKRIGKTDFALLYMPGKGDQRNLLNFFPPATVANENVRYVQKPCRLVLLEQEIKKAPEGDKNIQVPKRSVHGIQVSSNHVSPSGVEPYWGGTYTSPVDTFTGMCGSVIVTEGNGPFIVGLHSAGVAGKRIASYCSISRDDVEQCIRDMTAPEEPMMQGSDEGPMNLDFEQMPFKNELPKNNHFEYIENAEVDIVGCHAGRKRRYTTMVRQTDYSDAVAEKFLVAKDHGPPALMNHWYPARLWAESCANSKPMSMIALKYAFRNFREKVFKHFAKHPDDKEDICVLEDIVNTSGLDGVKGLFKMNLTASAGIPYCKPKKDYVKASADFFDGITVPYELTDEMKADVKELEDIYKSGARGYAPHRANRKDEAIRIGKAKVRIFSGTSMPYLFLMRKYFLTISVYMQRHPEVFESAVGTNPYSTEWTKLYKYITKHGVDRIVAGDYEKYDQFVHSSLTYAAFKLLMQIAEWAGFDEEDLMVMRGLATDTCNPLYELDGLWLKFGGSSPSGHGLTVVLNGIVNSFYARMAWYIIQERDNMRARLPIADFNKYVSFMSYGDDNIMSVSEEASWFNHCSYQLVLKAYGLNYTMADKTAESVPYIKMEDANFLKRKWVYSEQYKRHLAPLELDSIFKMLHTFVVSKVSPKEQQLADILRSANQEFFMHGEKTFLDAREKLAQIASEYELNHYLPGGQLPNLEEMDSWYREM